MRRPTVLAMGLLWLAVVVAVSALTWTVIDSAGRDVLTSGGVGSVPGDAASPRGDPASSATSRGVDRDPGRDRGDRPRTSPAPSLSDSPDPGPSSLQTPSEAPSRSSAPGPSPSSEGTGPPDPPPTQVRSWQGAAGSVAVRCEGSEISLQSASPADGWRIEVKKRGPDEVDVELESGGDDEQRTRVRSECGGGVPIFEVDSDD